MFLQDPLAGELSSLVRVFSFLIVIPLRIAGRFACQNFMQVLIELTLSTGLRVIV